MKKAFARMLSLLLLTSLVLTLGPFNTADAAGTTYYVDSATGNDANSGTSAAAAWKSLTKVNATTFQPGDQILFKSGGVWNGQLWPKGSGSAGLPVTISLYGGTVRPVINGGRRPA